MQIWSVFAKKRGLSRKAGPPVHEDLVDRQFTAPAPNVLWLTLPNRASSLAAAKSGGVRS
jgi:hypothetical protein